MQLELSAEDAAFREEMRTFFTTEFPQEIRDTVLEGRHLTREQIVESQQVLNKAGPRGPPLARGVGRSRVERPAAPPVARGDAAGRRARRRWPSTPP